MIKLKIKFAKFSEKKMNIHRLAIIYYYIWDSSLICNIKFIKNIADCFLRNYEIVAKHLILFLWILDLVFNDRKLLYL